MTLTHPAERLPPHCYKLRPHIDSEMLVGRTSDGRQFATAPHYDGNIFVFFSATGEFLDSEEYPDSVFPQRRDNESFPAYLQFEPRFRLTDKIDCVLEPIEMSRFFIDDYGIGIEDYPAHWRQIIDHPESDREALAALPQIIENWLAERNYVLYWNDDYWVNGDGEIVAT